MITRIQSSDMMAFIATARADMTELIDWVYALESTIVRYQTILQGPKEDEDQAK